MNLTPYLQTIYTAFGAIAMILISCLVFGFGARTIAQLVGASRKTQENTFAGYFFAAPWIVGFVIFVLGPMLFSLYWSFTRFALPDPPQWIGLGNYTQLLTGADRDFRSAVFNTLYMTIFGLPLQLLAALGMALLLNQRVRGERIFRMAFYMPVILAGNAAMLISWRLMYNANNGIINTLIRNLSAAFPPIGWLNRAFIYVVEVFSAGFSGVQEGNYTILNNVLKAGFPAAERVPLWIQSPLWAKPAIIILLVWSAGSMMMFYLAALNSVPREIYEAAEVDGANSWQKFRHITLALISPTTFYNLVVGIIAMLQIFEASYSLTTNGGPGRATYFVAYYLWRATFRFNQLGYGAAMSWILFIVILIITAIQFRLQDRWVQYDLK